MSEYAWEPVGEPIGPVELEIEYYTHGDVDIATHYDAGHLGDDWVSLGGDVVTTINWGAHEDYRICRRVPAQGVPVEVRERLAAVAHEIWAHWMHYLFSKCEQNPDGSVTIPVGLVLRWCRQIDTPYNELSEQERESDRHQADKIMAAWLDAQPQPGQEEQLSEK